jgi:hypothetical protein
VPGIEEKPRGRRRLSSDLEIGSSCRGQTGLSSACLYFRPGARPPVSGAVSFSIARSWEADRARFLTLPYLFVASSFDGPVSSVSYNRRDRASAATWTNAERFRVDGYSNPGRFFSDAGKCYARSAIFRKSVHVLWCRPRMESPRRLSLSCQISQPRPAKWCGATILGWGFSFDRRDGSVRTSCPLSAPHMLPSATLKASAPTTLPLSRLNIPPRIIAVYASPWSLPPTAQHSLPGRCYPLPGPDFHRLDLASFLAHSCLSLNSCHS